MAFALQSKESVATGLRRIAGEQLDKCLNRLGADPGTDRAEAIHGTRTDLKKLRALLRLAKPALGKKTYKRDNAACRDAGRALSAVRDAVVCVEALSKLSPQAKEVLDPATVDELRAYFVARRDALPDAQRPDLTATMRDVAGRLEAVRERTKTWCFKGHGFAIVRDGLARSYTRGQAARDAAYAQYTDETFHAHRKRVKDLWYQVRLLENAWPSVLASVRQELKVLSDLLGADHDLAMLRQSVASAGVFADATVAALNEGIDARRASLQDQARPIGERVYRDHADIFVGRFEVCFRAWHERK
jgi:CHAD domain-containing protein